MKQNKQNKVLFFQETTPRLYIKSEANISMGKKKKKKSLYSKFV